MTSTAEFDRQTGPFRRELLAHCYRMLGSAHDAEDAVQDTYLRAWRAFDGFENRSSLRTWLYRIATNACLNALAHSSRRVLPSGLGPPSPDPDSPQIPAVDVAWVQPIPGARVVQPSDDPEQAVVSKESMRLAVIAARQHLPPQERAVLLLRDVMAFSAADAAAILDTTVPAVRSSLQRARARMRQLDTGPVGVIEPADPRARALVEAYVAAFEQSDPALLSRALSDDAALETIGSRVWFKGRSTCVPYLTRQVLGTAGDWKMLVIEANTQPAVAAYRRDRTGTLRAFGIAVLAVTHAGIGQVAVYPGADLVTDDFHLPESMGLVRH